MIIEQDQAEPGAMLPEIVWRNPENTVRAQLRAKEESDPYYGWAEQARKIRARRAQK